MTLPMILVADDDEDDREMMRDAFTSSRVKNPLMFVEDGVDLLAYLERTGRFAAPESSPRPMLIVLDLNMPRKDGREALAEIKRNPLLRHIPVVVLTTSEAADDVIASYQSGANSYIAKPATFDELVRIVCCFQGYWLETVQLPAVEVP